MPGGLDAIAISLSWGEKHESMKTRCHHITGSNAKRPNGPGLKWYYYQLPISGSLRDAQHTSVLFKLRLVRFQCLTAESNLRWFKRQIRILPQQWSRAWFTCGIIPKLKHRESLLNLILNISLYVHSQANPSSASGSSSLKAHVSTSASQCGGGEGAAVCHGDHKAQLTEDGLYLAYALLQPAVPGTNSGS